MKRFLVPVAALVVIALGTSAASAATEVSSGTSNFVVPSCTGEAVLATGTYHIVATEDLGTTVVTFGGITAVGADSGRSYRVSFGFSAQIAHVEFVANTQSRLVVIDPTGEKLVAQVITHFSWLHGDFDMAVSIRNQFSRCVG